MATNDDHARLKLDSSSDNGSKQLDEFDIPEVKTCGSKLQMNLLKKKERVEEIKLIQR